MNFFDLMKDTLNRVGTKAIVALVALYLIFELAKELVAVNPVYALWGLGGIVFVTLAFFTVRYLTNDKGDPEQPNSA